MDQKLISCKDIYRYLEECGCILEGHFILSSGLHSGTYLQCARLFSYPANAARVCSLLADQIERAIDISSLGAIISPAVGGIILGYEISSQLSARGYSVPNVFCERKEGHFLMKRFDTEWLSNQEVAIVEDVITTGGSSLEVANYMESIGSKVKGIFSLIDRRANKETPAVIGGYPLHSLLPVDIPCYQESELPQKLAQIPPKYLGSKVRHGR